jgi:hypothetical protein
MAYTKYSLTPANNTAAPPDGAPEGMLPSAVNDTMRDMMAQIRDCGDGIRDGTYTMTAPKITGGTITGSTINNSAIGGTTAAAGAFTTLSATGVTTVQAGTVSLPAITTTGDTNTGIYFPAADTIAFTEGGVESMRIDSSGNVGIGTSSPTARLGIPIPEFSASSTSGMVRFQNPNVAADSCIQSYYVSSDGSDINIGANSYVNTSGSTVRFSDSYASSAINIRRDGVLAFRTNTSAGVASERMRIDSSGNVGIGTSSPSSYVSNGGLAIDNTVATNTGQVVNLLSSGSSWFKIGRLTASSTAILQSGQDLALQPDSGNLLVGATGQISSEKLGVTQSANSQAITISATNASYTADAFIVYASRNTTNNSFYVFNYFNTGASAYKFRVADSGNVTNTNNSYGSISDIKLKENIVDASPKLEKLCQVKVRNFNIIGDEQKQLGVVAQELEQIFPSMIEESPDKDIDGNDLGTTTKLVKYSVFVPMLIKAMQEQQAMITELNAKVEAQAVRIAELESK